MIWPQTVSTVWGLKTILQRVTSLRSSHDSEWSRPKYSQLGLTHHQRRKWILLTPVDHGLTDLVWLDQRCQSILFHHLFSFFFFFSALHFIKQSEQLVAVMVRGGWTVKNSLVLCFIFWALIFVWLFFLFNPKWTALHVTFSLLGSHCSPFVFPL